MSTRPSWTITRAAAECGVSRDTIKRRRTAGGFPNAHQDQRGQWLIPLEDLLAAGLRPGAPSPPDPEHQGMHQVHDDDAPGARPSADQAHITELNQQIQLLRLQLETEQRLRAAAEQNADDLRTSMRMLEARPTPETATAPRRRWFGTRATP